MTAYRISRAFIISAAAVFLLACWSSPAASQGVRVAVFPMKNNGQAQYNGLASGIAAMFTTNLNKSDAIEVVEPQAVFGAIAKARLAGGAPTTTDAMAAAQALDAAYAVTGEFVMFGGRFRIDIRVYDPVTGQLKFADKAQDKEDQFFSKVDELSDRIIINIAGSLPKAKGGLQVNSVPAGAAVLVDGDDAGVTPAGPLAAGPGAHEVSIELYGYHPYKETVVVKEGETAALDVKLVPLYGGIRVWWKEQPSSDVSIGDTLISASNFKFDAYNPPSRYCKNLPAGTYKLSVRMPYKDETSWDTTRAWKTYTEDIEVTPGEVEDVYLYNHIFGPAVQVSTCTSCAGNWDFDTQIVWYEQVQ